MGPEIPARISRVFVSGMKWYFHVNDTVSSHAFSRQISFGMARKIPDFPNFRKKAQSIFGAKIYINILSHEWSLIAG